jgi:hypothetical protein
MSKWHQKYSIDISSLMHEKACKFVQSSRWRKNLKYASLSFLREFKFHGPSLSGLTSQKYSVTNVKYGCKYCTMKRRQNWRVLENQCFDHRFAAF